MINRGHKNKWVSLVIATLVLGLSSCGPRKSYQITQVEGTRIHIDSTLDVHPNQQAVDVLAPYKAGVDSVMGEVVGYSTTTLSKYRPESPLSNLIADVLRQAAAEVVGHPADIGLVNMGGIRNILPQGNITVGTVYEILPFENSLCVLKIKGKHVQKLMQNIAQVQGEGVSNIQLEITKEGKVLSVQVGGKSIEEDKIYTLATIDYLSEGNDGMTALIQQESRECPTGATLRGLFMDYVKQQTAAKKQIFAQIEGRIVIK